MTGIFPRAKLKCCLPMNTELLSCGKVRIQNNVMSANSNKMATFCPQVRDLGPVPPPCLAEVRGAVAALLTEPLAEVRGRALDFCSLN